MRTIKPKCRYCGTKVDAFGDICSQCTEAHVEDDGFLAILKADTAALAAKGDES